MPSTRETDVCDDEVVGTSALIWQSLVKGDC